MSYKKLAIWQIAREVSVEIHKMTIKHIPKFEMFEEGSQIRRSSKSIRSNIVEGYGRRRYKNEFIRFLFFSQASCDETVDHLETLFETGSLKNEDIYHKIHARLQELGKKINLFIQAVEREHRV